MRCPHLEHLFENLRLDYDQNDVSPATPRYNCIAWAAGENHRRWWPADWDRATYLLASTFAPRTFWPRNTTKLHRSF